MWYMFPIQREELRINHLTPLLVVTMPYARWILWWANCSKDFKWRLHFQIGVALWWVVLREVYFEGPNGVWRALKTPILNIALGLIYGNGIKLWSTRRHLQKQYSHISWKWSREEKNYGKANKNAEWKILLVSQTQLSPSILDAHQLRYP